MEIKIFENNQFGKVRTMMRDGEPWFVGKDVANILGYTNPQKAIRDHVDDEDRGVNELFTPGGKQDVAIINESGLYSLVLSSKLPSAKAFKRWITHEVIPAIRKHGMYATPETVEQILNDPDSMIQILQTLKAERNARIAAEETNKLNAPKVLFADCVSQADTDILIGELAKILKQNGMKTGQNRLFDQLRNEGFIMKNGTMPTQLGMEMGLFRVIERTVNNADGSVRITKTTKVTGKGQQYFINKYIGNKEKPQEGETP